MTATGSANPLTVQLLEWVAAGPRTYEDMVETWRTSCPRLSIWEDALTDGLVGHRPGRVVVTPRGLKVLAETASS